MELGSTGKGEYLDDCRRYQLTVCSRAQEKAVAQITSTSQ